MTTVGLQIGPADHGRKMTLEEFREADAEEGYRYELARGVLEVVEVPDDAHGLIVYRLQKLWGRYDDAHPGNIWRIGGGGEFRLWVVGMVSGRNPDGAIVLVGTPKDDRGRRPPALVAEVVSRRGEIRDYHEKREEYWFCGAREYWIVDPALRQVLVLIRRDDRWEERIFRDDEIIAGELLPGFTGMVAELWVDLDEEV